MLPMLALLLAVAADPEPVKAAPPVVKFTGVTPKGMLDFEVTNPNAHPLSYFGYTANSYNPPLPEGTIAPLYLRETRTGEAWRSVPGGFCGTGVGPVTLPA